MCIAEQPIRLSLCQLSLGILKNFRGWAACARLLVTLGIVPLKNTKVIMGSCVSLFLFSYFRLSLTAPVNVCSYNV